jgi:diacylglycerol kinase family enzyme
MKYAHILHNPGAGEENYSDKELISLIEGKGFSCSYSSLQDNNWNEFQENDFLIITGGDGTVRKVIKELLGQQSDLNFPIALIPAGTANNIAKSMEISSDTPDLIENWHNGKIRHFDIGIFHNTADQLIFLESFGYGLFPKVMKEMKNVPKDLVATPDQKIKKGLEVIQSSLSTYKSSMCTINIEGNEYKGQFLMVEVMNTPSFGPNLTLAPDADPCDGKLDVVLIYEHQRDELAAYIDQRLKGKELDFETSVLTGKSITIAWEGADIHADDEIIEDLNKKKAVIGIYGKQINFLVP